MTATRAIRELVLFRPGRPGKAIRLQVFRQDAAMACLQIAAGENEIDWGVPQQRAFPAADDAAIEVRLAREAARWRAEGYQDPGLALPPCAPEAVVPLAAIARLRARLDFDQWRLLAPAKQARLVWRLGELQVRECAPALAALLGTGDSLLDYCLVWALGRCGSPAQAEAVAALAKQRSQRKDERAEAVQRLARLAWLELAPETARQRHLDELVEDWPRALRGAWRDGDPAALEAALADPASFERISLGDWLEQLDQLARFDSRARAVLHAQLARVKVEAGVFRAMRHLYKAAEMRGDAASWAQLARRFEEAAPTFGSRDSHCTINRRWVKARDELVKPTSSLAWSRATRDYFLRRCWRTLRRLGLAGSTAFAELAFAVLMRCDEARTQAPRVQEFSNYDYRNRQWLHTQRHYPAFSRSLLFNRLLHGKGERLRHNRNATNWWSDAALGPRTVREEAFASLWDARPDLLLRLLLESRAEAVHAFAALALGEQTAYLASINGEVWLRLLNSSYACTAEFALAQLLRRIEGTHDTAARIPWLILLVACRHEAVWQAALNWISEDPARYAADARLVAAMLTARHKAVRQQARLLCQASLANPGVAENTVAMLMEWLEALDFFSEDPEAAARDLVWAVGNPLRSVAAQVDHLRLQALLASPCAAAQIAAVDWLLVHNTPVAEVASSTYKTLLDSPDEAVQAAGVRLFGALPEGVLLTQGELVARFCSSTAAAVRKAATPVLARLVPAHPAFAQTLATALSDTLFRAEAEDGVHAHITALLTDTLAAGSRALDAARCLRLLTARSRAAQTFGAWLLAGRAETDFSTREWAMLGRNDSQDVRQRALQVLAQRLEADGAQLDEVLGVLDTRWDDVRVQAIELLRHKVSESAWQPERLIALCDHLHPAVQAFGRALIEPRLKGDHALDYLLPLTEHPAPRMQQFVACWLEASLPEDVALLGRLRPYFITVLSQVNRGRPAKSAVQTLLRRLALQSEAAAREVAAIFERLALTVAIADRAQYIAGLYEIRARFPDIGSALTVVAPELRKGAA